MDDEESEVPETHFLPSLSLASLLLCDDEALEEASPFGEVFSYCTLWYCTLDTIASFNSTYTKHNQQVQRKENKRNDRPTKMAKATLLCPD